LRSHVSPDPHYKYLRTLSIREEQTMLQLCIFQQPSFRLMNKRTGFLHQIRRCAEAPPRQNAVCRNPSSLRWPTSPNFSGIQWSSTPEIRMTLIEVLGILLRMELVGLACLQTSSMAAPWETTTTRSPVNADMTAQPRK
jgi:hypothetical protein